MKVLSNSDFTYFSTNPNHLIAISLGYNRTMKRSTSSYFPQGSCFDFLLSTEQKKIIYCGIVFLNKRKVYSFSTTLFPFSEPETMVR